MSTSSAPKPEFDTALRIHEVADQNFNSRVNAFLVAQSFLVSGFVVLSATSSPEQGAIWLSIIVSILGFGLTILFWSRFRRSNDRLWKLKRQFLVGNPVYFFFMTGNMAASAMTEQDRIAEFEAKRSRSHDMADLLPLSFLLFWVASFLYTWKAVSL